jgi:hypothetical protein
VEEVAENLFWFTKFTSAAKSRNGKQSTYRSAGSAAPPKTKLNLSFSATSGARALPYFCSNASFPQL